jgi:endonuclease YncB( thermonuclease family)
VEVAVTSVIDGDTIDTTGGKVRLIGIDTPERGDWGYTQATTALADFVGSGPVTIVAAGRDDRDATDRYGRLLRYVRVGCEDAGIHLISAGWAVARYDSRDGYGAHPLEADYIALDTTLDDAAVDRP